MSAFSANSLISSAQKFLAPAAGSVRLGKTKSEMASRGHPHFLPFHVPP
jgi:hypothetical protein